jgi:hypothetical protein
MKKITLEKYLYLKGFTKRGTSYHKIKTNKGIAKAFVELFFNNLKDGNVLELQKLVNEFKDYDRKKSI